MSHCVGCGYCCIKAMCSIGIAYHGRSEERCPYLVWNGSMYRCRLVTDNLIDQSKLTTGFGCTSNMNTWRKNVRER